MMTVEQVKGGFTMDKVKMDLEYGVSGRWEKFAERILKEWYEEPLKKMGYRGATRGHAWTVTLKYEGHQYTFPYFSGPDNTALTKYDVLTSLRHDSLAGGMDFEEFLSEFGYDDRKRAREVWKRCQRIRRRMERLLGEDFESFLDADYLV